jgi:hypothetical protein
LTLSSTFQTISKIYNFNIYSSNQYNYELLFAFLFKFINNQNISPKNRTEHHNEKNGETNEMNMKYNEEETATKSGHQTNIKENTFLTCRNLPNSKIWQNKLFTRIISQKYSSSNIDSQKLYFIISVVHKSATFVQKSYIENSKY